MAHDRITAGTPDVNGIGMDSGAVSRPLMALDALSQLTSQFAQNPDFANLVKNLLLTLCGQLAAPSAFIAVRNPGSPGAEPVAFATGRYAGDETLTAICRMAVHDAFFLHHPKPCRVNDFALDDTQPNTTFKLAACGVQVVAPLLQDRRLIGLLGLGPKACGREYADDELELLATILGSVTPLIVNSFLVTEISTVNAWYLDILDNVRQGVFVFDSNFQLKKSNRAGYRILERYTPGTTEGRALTGTPMHLLFPDLSYPGWGRHLIKARSDRQGQLIESLVAKSAGSEAIFNVRVSLLRRETGSRSDIIVTLDDITEQKDNEQRLFELEKFAEKGVMASSIAHELNNFLGLILGGVELSTLAVNRGASEKALSSLERVKEHIGQMKRFTTGLMDYTRLEMRKEAGSLNELLRDVLSFVTVQKKFKRIEIYTDFDPALPEFAFDRDQMAQLLLNLLNNAADAIAGRTDPEGRISVETRLQSGDVELTVGDNGLGMTDEVKQSLFRTRLTTKKDGHGFGLVTCARILENHGAKIDIESAVGRGSTFRFRFPHETPAG